MNNWNRVDLLDMVECYAEEYKMRYVDEKSLSDDFDLNIAPLVIEKYGVDDSVAMNEEFNNWSDNLCKDGQLHEEQYKAYCYVGKYSD